MTRDELCALPPAMAIKIIAGLLLDNSDRVVLALAEIPKPKVPLPPKYDQIIYRKDGIQYASEMDLGGLQYWHRLAVESAEGGGEYAAKDEKKAKSLPPGQCSGCPPVTS